MAVLFQVVLFGVAWIGDWWGNPGVVLSGIVLGLTDVDALTLSMARGAADGIPIDVAARAVTVGVLTNTVVKLGVAMVLGRAEFRWLAGPTLAAMAAALGISLVLR
jgi:uncharacterized membrane protein (DUF4010 family)